VRGEDELAGNHAPVASDITAATAEHGPAIVVTPVVSDADAGDTKTFAIDTTLTKGTVALNQDGTFSYDPAGAFDGLRQGETATDTFTYTVTDAAGATATATVAITVTGQNETPAAADVTAVADEDGPAIVITPVVSDADLGDTQAFAINTTLTKGSVTLNPDGTFSYDPAAAFDSLGAGETAADTFTYTVTDGAGATATATVTITIRGKDEPAENHVPTAADVSAAVDEHGPSIIVAPAVTDQDVGDARAFTIDTTVTTGTVAVNPDGTFSYDPAGAFDGLMLGETATDTFTYTVTDGAGATATATVTITIRGQNEAPVAADVAATAEEHGPAIVVSPDASDADIGDTRAFDIDTSMTKGTVTLNPDGTFSYDPAGAFDGLKLGASATDSFSYTVTDAAGATATATVTITIRGQNEAPTAADVTAVMSAHGQAMIITPVVGDADIGDTKAFAIDTSLTKGTVVLNPDGTMSYDPGRAFDHLLRGATATDSFTYTMTDGAGATATATVTITIVGEREPVGSGENRPTGFEGPMLWKPAGSPYQPNAGWTISLPMAGGIYGTPDFDMSSGGLVVAREGVPVLLPIPLSDRDLAGAASVTIDWGDGGAVETISKVSDAIRLKSHVYADDSGNGIFKPSLTIRYADGRTVKKVAPLKVVDVPAKLENVQAQLVSESGGGMIMVRGRIVDPGVHDRHVVSIRWGDGSVTEAIIEVQGGEIWFSARRAPLTPGQIDERIVIAVRDTARPGSGSEVVLDFGGQGAPEQLAERHAHLEDGDLWFAVIRSLLDQGKPAEVYDASTAAMAGLAMLGLSADRDLSRRGALRLTRGEGRKGLAGIAKKLLGWPGTSNAELHRLPIAFRSHGAVKSIDFTLRYDPELLHVEGVEPGADLSESARLTFVSQRSEAGHMTTTISVRSHRGLPSGVIDLANLVVDASVTSADVLAEAVEFEVESVNGHPVGRTVAVETIGLTQTFEYPAETPLIRLDGKARDARIDSNKGGWKADFVGNLGRRAADLEGLRIVLPKAADPENT
jgi:VCBS repeat-containing protein